MRAALNRLNTAIVSIKGFIPKISESETAMKPPPPPRHAGAEKQSASPDGRSGFTLTETVFASSLALFLFLVMLEALFFCRRSAANLKWQLAADALAYDTAMDVFNRKTSWFEANATTAISTWSLIPAERTSVWFADDKAYYYVGIFPDASPANSWKIVTDVAWPLPNGGSQRLRSPCIIERRRVDRNLFRNTP